MYYARVYNVNTTRYKVFSPFLTFNSLEFYTYSNRFYYQPIFLLSIDV